MQVLTSLEPLDYAFVAFLPGISEVRFEKNGCYSFTISGAHHSSCLCKWDPQSHFHLFLYHVRKIIFLGCVSNSQELLFRGALLPLFGINLTSAMAVAALFGILHLGNGRKFSFAIWYAFPNSGNLGRLGNNSKWVWLVGQHCLSPSSSPNFFFHE